jgi:hypothetical protein
MLFIDRQIDKAFAQFINQGGKLAKTVIWGGLWQPDGQ